MLMFTDEQSETVITYRIIRAREANDESIEEAYGIEAQMSVGGTAAGRAWVGGVFCAEDEANELLRLLAENGAQPCHIVDIIQDFL